MRLEKEKLMLEVVLTPEEHMAYSKEMAERLNRKTRAEDNLKSASTQFKAEIQAHSTEMNRVAPMVLTGRETRYVECRIAYNWEAKTREWFRMDTGELVKTDIIPEEDFQEHIRFPEEEKQESEPAEESKALPAPIETEHVIVEEVKALPAPEEKPKPKKKMKRGGK